MVEAKFKKTNRKDRHYKEEDIWEKIDIKSSKKVFRKMREATGIKYHNCYLPNLELQHLEESLLWLSLLFCGAKEQNQAICMYQATVLPLTTYYEMLET